MFSDKRWCSARCRKEDTGAEVLTEQTALQPPVFTAASGSEIRTPAEAKSIQE